MALLPSNPKRQKQVMLMLAPVALIIAAWYFLYSPTKQEVERLQTRVTKIQASNREAVKQIREGEDLGRKLAIYEQHRVLLEQLIPSSQEVPELLYDMTMRAQAAGVAIALMRPEPPQSLGYYTRQSYEMGVVGGYHNVGRFLAEIGSLPRIVTPVDLRMQTRRERSANTPPRIEASFRITTYVQPPSGTVIEGTLSSQRGQRRTNVRR
jgi:type IV pilus assembly protein PilO